MSQPIKSIQVDALIEFAPGYKEASPEAANALLTEITDKVTAVVSQYLPATGEFKLNPYPDQTKKAGK